MVWFDPSTTTIQTSPAVVVPTGIVWEPPPLPVGVQKTITGEVVSTYGPPHPAKAVQFQKRVNLTGNWAYVLNTVPDTNGVFAFTYKSKDSICEYRVVYPGTGVFQASVSSVFQQVFAVGTVTSVPSMPAALYKGGSSFIASGSVRDQFGEPVPTGQVELWTRNSNGPSTAWRKAVSATNVATDGIYRITCPMPTTTPGPYEWKVKFLGGGVGGYYLASESTAVSRPLKLGTTTIATGGIDYSNASFSWSAVPGVTGYYLQHSPDPDANCTTFTSVGPNTLSYTHTGLVQNSYHKYQVLPYALDAAGNEVYGAASPTRACTMGSASIVKSAPNGEIGYEALCIDSNSWRSTDGWAYADVGDAHEVKQGYFSSEASNWYGVMRYNGDAFINYIAGTFGADVLPNLVATHTFVYLRRNTTSGNGTGAVSPRWFVTSALPGQGGQPSYAGGDVRGSYGMGAEGWTELQAHWGKHVLLHEQPAGTGPCQSFLIMYNGLPTYAAFSSPYLNAGYCKMHFYCTWNFTSVAAVGPRWL